MSILLTSLTVLVCLFGGALVGMRIRVALPGHHLSDESKSAVWLGIGLVVTMSALVLGLLISSAHTAFEAERGDLTKVSAKIVWVDRILAHYGPEAREARQILREVAKSALDRLWSGTANQKPSTSADLFYEQIRTLSPRDDAQRSSQAAALSLARDIAETRWLMYEEEQNALPMPLLVGLVFWLTIVFVSIGLFAPRNPTVVVSFFVSALSVAGAIFLILEMYMPFSPPLQISSAPLQAAIDQLGH